MGSPVDTQNLRGKLGWVPTLLYQLLFASICQIICQVAWSAETERTLPAAHTLSENTSASGLLQSSKSVIQMGDRSTAAVQIIPSIAQTSPIEVTGVQVTATATGLEILLQTAQGELNLPTPRAVGNALIADLANAVIAEEFSQVNPIAGIALVSVTGLPDNRVRVAITGTDAPPTADIRTVQTGLTFGVTTGTATAASSDEAIQVVVTGEEDEGYSPSEATTATRTDTPLRDIPQSIQIVPRQVIEDQAITRTSDALRNVSGVSVQRDFGDSIDIFTIRGFSSFQSLRNGARVESAYLSPDNIERIEVLKGPASVLYGQFEPGGIVNYVTEQPLSDPYYAFEFTGGSYSLYRPAIDLSGPLTDDERLLYRLNVSYENAESYIDFVNGTALLIAPTLSYRLGDSTSITLEYEYIEREQTFFNGLLPIPETFDLPRERNLGESDDEYRRDINNITLTIDHRLNESLRLRNSFNAFFSLEDFEGVRADTPLDPENLTVPRFFQDNTIYQQTYSIQTDLIANFNTGSIAHQLLFGVNFQWDFRTDEQIYINAAPLNIFDPVYGRPLGEFDSDPFNTFVTRSVES